MSDGRRGERAMSKREVYVPDVLRLLANAIERESPREDCTTCRYGEYGNPRCYSCAVNYESHYVRKEASDEN